jgi:predicted lipoprotein
MRRILIAIGLLVALGALFWLFPLLHVVRLQDVRDSRQRGEFRAHEFAKEFWTTRLMPSLDRAADVAAVLAVAREDPHEARQQFGRSVGLGRAAFYLLRGRGTVVSVDKDGVGVSTDAGTSQPDVLLHTGLVFGNTVRDATGLLSAGDFIDSQQFNDVSTELNHIVETRVLPPLQEQARVGRRLEFIGCAEVMDESDWRPLRIIPLDVKVD